MSAVAVAVYAAVWAITVVAIGRVISKAGYSLWWVLAPLALSVVTYVSISAVHAHDHTPWGALDFDTLRHTEWSLLLAEGASLVLLWVLFVAFAFADWPARRLAGRGAAVAGRRDRSGTGRASDEGAQWQAHVRVLPTIGDQPPGWYASGTVGSGEQCYWDGVAWTARRVWRFESWVDLPLDDAPEQAAVGRK